MLNLNLQYISDPLQYLRKQKLRALSLPEAAITNVKLITQLGVIHEFGIVSNLELINLIQELIDVSCDAMTIFCEQRSLYVRHQNHFWPIPTTNALEC
jgi:hypothetical protein